MEKDRYVESKDTDRNLRNKEHSRIQDNLQKQIDELRRENEILKESEHEWKIREGDLKS